MQPDYYDILGLPENATSEDIRNRYRELVKKYHPDRIHDPKSKCIGNEKVKLINNAYSILSDPVKRKEYDIMRSNHKDDNNNYRSYQYDYSSSNNYYHTPQPEPPHTQGKTITEIMNIAIVIYIVFFSAVAVLAGLYSSNKNYDLQTQSSSSLSSLLINITASTYSNQFVNSSVLASSDYWNLHVHPTGASFEPQMAYVSIVGLFNIHNYSTNTNQKTNYNGTFSLVNGTDIWLKIPNSFIASDSPYRICVSLYELNPMSGCGFFTHTNIRSEDISLRLR